MRGKRSSVFVRFAHRKFVANVSLMLMLSMTIPWQAFANEELFRQTKEPFTPHPFIQPDLSTGVFSYSRPVTTPPGRNGMQPDIKLTYNSSANRQDSLLGYGWSLNIPYIERLNKNGSDKLYNQDLAHSFFYSSLTGELLQIGTTTPVNGSVLGASFSTPLFTPARWPAHLAQLDNLPPSTFVSPSTTDAVKSSTTPVAPTATSGGSSTPVSDSSSTAPTMTAGTTTTASALPAATSSPQSVPTSGASTTSPTPASTSQSAIVFPAIDTAASATPQITTADVVSPDGSLVAFGNEQELTAERTLTSKRYFEGVNPNGTLRMKTSFFTAPIHYADKRTNTLEDVDSRLTETNGGFMMLHDSYQTAFDTSGSKHLITVASGDMTFAVDSLTASSGPHVGVLKNDAPEPGHTLSYPDLLAPGIDLEVTTLDTKLVKEAVLKDSSVLQGTTGDYLEIPFLLRFNTAVTASSGDRVLTDQTPLVTSAAVTITDSNGASLHILPPTARAAGSVGSSTPQLIPIDIAYTATTSGIVMTKRIPVAFLQTALYPVRTDATFDFNPNGSALDGMLFRDATNESFASKRGATTADHTDITSADNNGAYLNAGTVSGNYDGMYRAVTLFDTSSLPDDAFITSATYSIYSHTGRNALSQSVVVDRPTPASNTALANADYNVSGKWDGVEQASNRITLATWAASDAYQTFTLNATGISNISLTSVTKLGMRLSGDFDNVAPTWASGQVADGEWYASEQGASKAPKLEVITQDNTDTATAMHVELVPNPLSVATSNPRFSALVTSASTTALTTGYEIEITASSTSWTSPFWDSGQQTLSSSTPGGIRTPEIFSTTTFPLDRTKYYWRMRLWDQMGAPSPWSTSGDYFIMNGTINYGAKVEAGDFTRYTHVASDTDSWYSYDKRGTKYEYGLSSTTQVTAAATSTFRWMLEKVTDTNGNYMSYSYTKDNGQLYPDKITYTSNGASAALYEVDFTLENRPDIATSTAPGFAVTTKERIKEILVRTNGQLTHRYQLSYRSGDNAVRSLLASVQESGWNASTGTSTLPAVSFTYSTSSSSWTQNTATTTKWVVPSSYFTDSGGADLGSRVFDVNGDGLPDLVWHGATNNVYINNGTSWVQNNTYTSPLNFSSSTYDAGVRLADINGDGYIDLVQSDVAAGVTYKSVYLGSANGWATSTQWVPPVTFVDTYSDHSVDHGVRLADVNGDGLVDLIVDDGVTNAIYINNGSQWVLDPTWKFPTYITFGNADAGVRILDVNGDGLADVVVARGIGDLADATYLNTGHGWQLAPTQSMPWGVFVGAGGDVGKRFIDVNGDGLPDLAPYDSGGIYFNTGNGWVYSTSTFPTTVIYDNGVSYIDLGVVVDDINGDGLPDVIKNGGSTKGVWLKDGVKADFLTKINNEKGGTMTITYGRTSALTPEGTQPNPSLQIAIDTLSTITSDPGFGGSKATTTYAYKGGSYYYTSPSDRQFAGFASSTQTNDLGHTVRTYYHQGNASDSANGEFNDHVSKIGLPYRTEVLDGTTSSANLYSRTINKWARADYGDGRNFVKLVQWLKQIFDGDSSHRDTAASTTYSDVTGNVLTREDWGEVAGNSDGTFTDLGTDNATTSYNYAASTTNATMSLPYRELVTDQSGTIKDTKWYYDALALGSLANGNQTKEERLTSGSSYASTTKTYDSYGNLLTATDPRGNTTTYVYDQYNLYPATSTNALSQSRTFAYDYSSGKVATATDENSSTFVTKYDGLNRPLEEDQPDFTTPTTLVPKAAYTYYDSTTSPSSVFKKNYLSTATTTDFYTYVDGLGRTIQTKRKAEVANGFITSDTVYNNIGSVGSQSLPYFTSATTSSTATATAYLFTRYAYDPQGRVLTIANAVGTTTNTYNDWELTITDPLSNKKDLIKDAWGNLYQVVEYLSPSSSGTTTNTWNRLGKLTKLTDASGNVRNFTYDNLGRQLSAEDLHAAAHTLFGTTTWTYDNAGNVVTLLNPRNQTINYSYDALNRVTSEDYTGAGGTEVSYAYDTCTNGVGRLCQSVRQGSATTTYAYNPIGLTGTEAKKIGSTWGTTTTTYLRNGSVDTITYPNNEQVSNVYNDAGDLNQVLAKKPASTTWQQVIQSTNYGPNGLPSFQDFGNNTETTWTYDATQLYRLTHKVTLSTSTTPGVPENLSL